MGRPQARDLNLTRSRRISIGRNNRFVNRGAGRSTKVVDEANSHRRQGARFRRLKLDCRSAIIAELVETETGKGADALDRRPQLAAVVGLEFTGACEELGTGSSFTGGALFSDRLPGNKPELDGAGRGM